MSKSAVIARGSGSVYVSPSPVRNVRDSLSNWNRVYGTDQVLDPVVLTNVPPEWLVRAGDRILELSRLPKGWDGYSAPPMDQNSLRQAWKLLRVLADVLHTQPSIVPTVLGGVSLEWHRDDVDAEIEFNPGRRAYLSWIDSTGRDFEGDNVELLSRFLDFVTRIF